MCLKLGFCIRREQRQVFHTCSCHKTTTTMTTAFKNTTPTMKHTAAFEAANYWSMYTNMCHVAEFQATTCSSSISFGLEFCIIAPVATLALVDRTNKIIWKKILCFSKIKIDTFSLVFPNRQLSDMWNMIQFYFS